MQVEELQPGMQLAETVEFNGRVMLPGNKVLTAPEIDALNRRFPALMLRVIDRPLDDHVEFQDDSRDREISYKVQSRIARCMAAIHARCSSRAPDGRNEIDFAEAQEAVAEIVQLIKTNRISCVRLPQGLNSRNYLATHAGSVVYLSMLLGSALPDYVAYERKRQTLAQLQAKQLEDLSTLGLGAAFADLGMSPMASQVHAERPLGEAEQELIREHPTAGADLLPDRFPTLAKMVVKTHHENFAGAGYPQGIGRNDLHVFTRIVRIADAFAAVTAEHALGKAKSTIRALWEMSVGPYRQFYDPVLMEVFPKIVQPFPIGARLRLIDGRYAVVVRHSYDHPFAPTVVVAFDPRNQPLKQIEPPVSLAEGGLMVKSFRSEDLSFLHGTACEPAAVPTRFRRVADAWYP